MVALSVRASLGWCRPIASRKRSWQALRSLFGSELYSSFSRRLEGKALMSYLAELLFFCLLLTSEPDVSPDSDSSFELSSSLESLSLSEEGSWPFLRWELAGSLSDLQHMNGPRQHLRTPTSALKGC